MESRKTVVFGICLFEMFLKKHSNNIMINV